MIFSGFQILMLSQCTQKEFEAGLNLTTLFSGMEDALERCSSSEEEEQMGCVGHSIHLSIEDVGGNLEDISLSIVAQPNSKNNEPSNKPERRFFSQTPICGHVNPTGNVCQRKGKCPFHNPLYSKKISKRGWTLGDIL